MLYVICITFFHFHNNLAKNEVLPLFNRWEKSGSRSYMLTNDPAHISDTDGRHESPRLETKDFITYSESSNQNISIYICMSGNIFPWALILARQACVKTSDHFTCRERHYKMGTLSLETQIYNRKETCPLPWRKIPSLSFKVV